MGTERSTNVLQTIGAPRDAILRCLRCGQDGMLELSAAEARCRSCDETFPSADGIPVLARHYDRLAREIDEARKVNPAWYETEQPSEIASPWRHHLRKRRLYVEGVLSRELAKRGGSKAARILDLGCGDGNHLPWLAGFAERLYGSDYNVVRLARARARFPNATLFLGDILDFPVAGGAFDIVFFNHVIEHIPADEAALTTVARILAPGGIMVLGTPNEGAWWWQLAYRRAPEVRATTDHVHFYTAESISAKTRAAGLEIVEIEHMGWGPPDWRLDGRIRKYKVIDDLFEAVGRRIMLRQASSLYVTATKPDA
jgi:SAM-dependent methyltransferase